MNLRLSADLTAYTEVVMLYRGNISHITCVILMARRQRFIGMQLFKLGR